MDFFQLPSFSLNLNAKLEHITSGRFEENASSLVCSTEGGKILIYTPRAVTDKLVSDIAEGSSELRTLSINGKVRGIKAGVLTSEVKHDILAIGMETTLRAYDVVQNSDLYFVSVNEGVTCITLHPPVAGDSLYLFAAGNGTIKGYNSKGEESNWILSGEDVTSMTTYVSTNNDHGLLVATKNSRVQCYKGEQVIFSVPLSDDLSQVVSLGKGLFGYLLGTNTVGVYSDDHALWKYTYSSDVAAIHPFDADTDGENELIVALKNGTLECRRATTGEVQSKGSMEENIVAICDWESVLGEKRRLAIATRDGIVKGFKPSIVALPAISPILREALQGSEENKADATLSLDSSIADMLAFLTQRKTDLEKDIGEMEELLKDAKSKKGQPADEGNTIPSSTKVKLFCKTNESVHLLEAHCETNNDVVIKALCLFSDLLFPQGCYLHFATQPQTNLHLPLYPPKSKALKVHAKVIAGNRGSDIYHVFDTELILKKFPLHVCIPEILNLESYVSFILTDRIDRVALWLGQAFPLVVKDTKIAEMTVSFRCFGLQDDPLVIQANQNPGGGVQVTIRGVTMETVSEVTQDIFDFFSVKEIESHAYFPKEMEAFKALLIRVTDLNHLRLQLTADIAERTSSAKIAIVKAEDARVTGDFLSMKKWLATLESENNELLKGYLIRQKNHEELLSSLKEVNKVIQFASRFRRGKAQARVVSECRQAMKENHLDSLQKIIETGTAESH